MSYDISVDIQIHTVTQRVYTVRGRSYRLSREKALEMGVAGDGSLGTNAKSTRHAAPHLSRIWNRKYVFLCMQLRLV